MPAPCRAPWSPPERATSCCSSVPWAGWAYAADAAPVTLDTLYDLASLTKVVVTAPLTMRLHEAGRLDLDAPVSTYLPEFAGGAKDGVTIADLLAHCGGLLWWADLYRQAQQVPATEVKQHFIARICELPLDYPPRTRTVYSDLGFILLGEVLERLTATPLDRLATEAVSRPWGWTASNTTRSRTEAADRTDRRRPSPRRRSARSGPRRNAYNLGGVAPHAGLFATARSLVPFAQMWLGAGRVNGRPMYRSRTVQRFTRRARLVSGSSRALGGIRPPPEVRAAIDFPGRHSGIRALRARRYGSTRNGTCSPSCSPTAFIRRAKTLGWPRCGLRSRRPGGCP